MTLDGYQELAHRTAVYPPALAQEYLALGICGEAGELANKIKKLIRGDTNTTELENGVIDELGDLLWYMAELANEIGISFEQVALRNLEKLKDREARNVVKGSGDHR